MKSIKEMVCDNKTVEFMFYRKNELWYKTECGFEFPVPTSDTGDAAFNNKDKAILYMRWIRKHLQSIEQALAEAS